MSWGVELWDQYDNISAYTNKAIDFLDVFANFVRQRCAIELEYASKIRRLTKSFVPKKTKEEEYQYTYTKTFLTVLNETNDVAGQHEVIAENLSNNVANNLVEAIKNLKEQRKKCLIEGARLNTKLYEQEEHMGKCKKSYEKGYKDAIKAQINYEKANANYDLSRAELDRQKVNAQSKSKLCEESKSHYALRLREFNDAKRAHYTNYLPTVLQRLQDNECDRARNYADFVRAYVETCKSVLPIITTCYDNVLNSADSIDPNFDNQLVIDEFKSGFTVPDDEAFVDLSLSSSPGTFQTSFTSSPHNDSIDSRGRGNNHVHDIADNPKLNSPQYINNSLPGYQDEPTFNIKKISSNGSLNILNHASNNVATNSSCNLSRKTTNSQPQPNSSSSSTSLAGVGTSTVLNIRNTLSGKNRQSSRKRNIFNIFSTTTNQKHDFSDLPPNQRRKKIIAKIDTLNSQLAQEKAGKDAMLRMKEVYVKNPSMGDPKSIDGQLTESNSKITKINSDLAKFQTYLQETESLLANINSGMRSVPQPLPLGFPGQAQTNSHYPPGGHCGGRNRNGAPLPVPPRPNEGPTFLGVASIPPDNVFSNATSTGYPSSGNSTLSSSTTNSCGNGLALGPGGSRSIQSGSSCNSFGSCSNSANNQIQTVATALTLPPNPNHVKETRSSNAIKTADLNTEFNHQPLSSSSSKLGGNVRGNDLYDCIATTELSIRPSRNFKSHDMDNEEEEEENGYFDGEDDLSGQPEPPLSLLGHCEALYDFDGTSEGSIPMAIGQRFDLIELDQGDGWTRVLGTIKTPPPSTSPRTTNNISSPAVKAPGHHESHPCNKTSPNVDPSKEAVEFVDGFVPTSYVAITLFKRVHSIHNVFQQN